MANLQSEIDKLHKSTQAENFWDDNLEAQQVSKRLSDLQNRVDKFRRFWEEAHFLEEMLEMTESEGEAEMYRETIRDLEGFAKRFDDYELLILFSGENDGGNAIVSMHAGAGGTEAQDWVEILLRMYTRWAEDAGYKVEILDLLDGDEAGVKSVTFMVSGLYAYGKLKCEEGVHRLIRISPFDSSGRRHTSFASVSV
ncbi:MAG: PCRF domain-containing protein, partial [Syntrophomonas sp.]|nr:PCRF domain-containing protein [Syntrophomonas sp.]